MMCERTSESVIVVGGGVAGIASALRLAQAGVNVTLLETRKKLGGRATSFQDVRTGLTIDNCQHITMACCTNYLRLLRDLGVESKIDWHDDIHWIEPGGRRSVMKPGALPAPGHMTGAFIGARFLTTRDKFAIARAMHAIMNTDCTRHRDKTFGAWLRSNRQPNRTIRRFWEPIIVSACNCAVETVCASSALHVFQEGFLANRTAGRMGVPNVPLVELYDRAQCVLAEAGGQIKLGVSVRAVHDRCVELADGEALMTGRVICAVPLERAVRLAGVKAREADPRFVSMAKITHSPILGVHLVFDRSVLNVHSAVLVDRPTQWIFSKPGEPCGSHLHAVISAADGWMALSEDEITRRVLADIHACLPASKNATLISSRPVKEKLATFAPTPEVEALRPATLGPRGLDGIILAGDYVQTGWPATMEGAARSGYMAAAAVLGQNVSQSLMSPLQVGAIVRVVAKPMVRNLGAMR